MRPLLHEFWILSPLAWPAILAMVAWRLARGRGLDASALVAALREGFAGAGGPHRGGWAPARAAASGNSAFDAWRDGELARLDAERRERDATRGAFAAFVECLRRARDREEFERFMRDAPRAGRDEPSRPEPGPPADDVAA